MPDYLTDSAKDGRSVTIVGIMVNCLLIVLKFLTGIYGHSQALVADAVHSFSDLFTDAVVLFGLHVGRRPPDEDHHFGHGRIETMASALIGIALTLTGVYIGYNAGKDIYLHNEFHPTPLALVGAILSIGCKEALYHYTVFIGKRINSRLIIANAWHHRSDSLSSVAVLIGVAGAQIRPSWHILDGFAALIVSLFIIKVGLDILKMTFREISDAAPPADVMDKIRECSLAVKGVIDAHDLRARSLAGRYHMEIHIVVDGSLSVVEGHRIAKEVECCLHEEIKDVDKVIVHVDPQS